MAEQSLVERLAAAMEKATPLPWRFDHDWRRSPSILGGGKIIAYMIKRGFGPTRGDHTEEEAANAALIPLAVNALPDLLARIAALEAALEEIMNLPGEVNLANYDHDDVAALNDAHIVAFTIARTALKGATDGQ